MHRARLTIHGLSGSAAVAGAVFGLDLFSKVLVRQHMDPIIIAQRVVITAVDNTRGPFSAFALGLTVALSTLVLAVFSITLLWSASATERIGLGLIVGGGLANFSERVLFHRVTDILTLGTSTWNLADVAILLGIVVTIVTLHRHPAAA